MRVSAQGSQVWFIAIGFLWAVQVTGQEFTISTIAGGAPPPTPAGAMTVSIGSPLGVAVDAGGNVYFPSSNCVFKLDLAGILTLVAGNSRPGYSGDGGPATSAQINNAGLLVGVAVDGLGNLYIADTNNQRVRRVSPSGIITTVAGTGEQGFSGDGGPATSARLRNPTAVAVDGTGNLYIADAGNGCVRRVSPSGIITTAPGTTDVRNDLVSIAVDSAQNLYISDYHTVRRVSPSGAVTTVAGVGPPADLFNPSGIAVDGSGSVYIADTNHYRVRRVWPSGVVTTVAGTGDGGFSGDGGAATSAQLGYPVGVALDPAGNLYIADRNNYRIRRVSPSLFVQGIISTIAGNGIGWYSGDGGPATSAQINEGGVAADGAGNVYIADSLNHRIRRVSPSGVITTMAGTGVNGYAGDGGPATSAQFSYPARVAVDAVGNLYIADYSNNRVRRVSAGIITTVAGTGTGGFAGDGGPATAAQLNGPRDLVLDASGNLYIADLGNQRIRRVSPTGTITTVAGNGVPGYSGDGGLATLAQLSNPGAVAADEVGNFYIADIENHRVRRVSPAGIITTVAGTGTPGFSGDGGPAMSAQLNRPASVALDGTGNLYIAELVNHRIRRLSLSSGIITTVAGTGVNGYSGDGGPASSAQLSWPSSLAVDTAGRVYFTTSNAIRLLIPPGTCTASAAPNALTAPTTGGTLTLTIQAAAGCAWTITGLPAWITASATSGSGSATVTLTATANTGAARSATITAAGTTVTISQSAAGGACTYSITPAAWRFTRTASAGTITVTTAAGCPWTATSADAWITITSGASGTGSGTVSYEVQQNTAAASRSGTITVAGLVFTVGQMGTVPQLVAAGTMPQIASGGTWRTTFTLVNNGSTPAMARLTFTDDNGVRLTLPLNFPQVGGPQTQAGLIEPVLDPGATLIIESEAPAAGPTLQGWADLSTDGAVTGFAVFRQSVGEREQEAVVPLETRGSQSYVLAFDNTGNFVTGVAVANLSSQAGTLSVIINDDWGRQIQTSPLTLLARGHMAFELNNLYPATAGKRGTVEFRAPVGGQISVLGLRFNPKGAFTTIPVMSK